MEPEMLIINNKLDKLSKWLDVIDASTIGKEFDIIERLYATSLAEKNVCAISMINLFVREHKIKIDRMKVLEYTFYSDASHFYRGKNIMYTLCPFKECADRYIFELWKKFN